MKRRVVVTGLGLLTPLGTGVERCWNRLINGENGIVFLKGRNDEYEMLPSRIGGIIERGSFSRGLWDVNEWMNKDEYRKMATFSQYAMGASIQAIQDSGLDVSKGDLNVGVCIGSGIGSLDDLVTTSKQFIQYVKLDSFN